MVFNIVKLTVTLKDFILGQYALFLPDSVIIDREKEWEVEQVLNSCWYQSSKWWTLTIFLFSFLICYSHLFYSYF